MGDRPGSSSRVRTSEDKVRRKDLCWSVRTVYVLEKRPDVSGPGLEEAGRYTLLQEVTLVILCSVNQTTKHIRLLTRLRWCMQLKKFILAC
jgi:hypothetical protein